MLLFTFVLGDSAEPRKPGALEIDETLFCRIGPAGTSATKPATVPDDDDDERD